MDMRFSREDEDRLMERLRWLCTVRRSEVQQKLSEARTLGDLCCNPAYDAAKNEQAAVEEEIRQIQDTIESVLHIEDDPDTAQENHMDQ